MLQTEVEPVFDTNTVTGGLADAIGKDMTLIKTLI